jgi:hypothetical protein
MQQLGFTSGMQDFNGVGVLDQRLESQDHRIGAGYFSGATVSPGRNWFTISGSVVSLSSNFCWSRILLP